jgi:hypothetical protein
VTVGFTDLEGERTLIFEGPASAEGHALLLTNATVRDANGSPVLNIRGGSNSDLAVVEESPVSGPHGVELRVGS